MAAKKFLRFCVAKKSTEAQTYSPGGSGRRSTWHKVSIVVPNLNGGKVNLDQLTEMTLDTCHLGSTPSDLFVFFLSALFHIRTSGSSRRNRCGEGQAEESSFMVMEKTTHPFCAVIQ